MSWEAFLDSGKEVPDEDVEKRLNDLKPEDRSMMIYTSGYISICVVAIYS